MGSLNLICPMCCGETFNNSQSLKYHLLSMTDNLYCPGCSQRIDSVLGLIQHLDKCGQTLETEEDTKVNPPSIKKQKLETEFVAEMEINENSSQSSKNLLTNVPNEGIMIVGGPRTITVDENGDIKLVDKIDTEDQTDSSLLGFKKLETLSSVSTIGKPFSSGSVVNVKIPVSVSKEAEKNVINILPEDSDPLVEEESQLMSVDDAEDSQELSEELFEVKEEFCEQETDAVYSCNSCSMSFTSVMDHINKYHDGQEVVLEMAEQQFEDLQANSMFPMECENVTTPRQRQMMNTLHAEECKDSDGRWYTRKVVQIEKFWDHNSDMAQSQKSPMIEKFFSNVEGVKVREKNVSSTPVRTYKCNRCMKQFTKFAEFRVHPCSNGSNQCEVCDQFFATPKALQLHVKIHEQDIDSLQKPFICPHCGTEFSTHKSLRLHSRMHAPIRARHVDAPEGIKETTFTCKECGKTFSESYRTAHVALHTGDSVTCTVCNRKFDSAESLAMHAAVHTELIPSHTRSPTPPLCETSTNNSSAMLTSIATDNVNVDTSTNMNSSASATTGSTAITTTDSTEGQTQKPYQCQHCGRRFARPHEKVKHERIHTGEKPHACEVCGKTFRVSYCLTLHMRTHTGHRPYECKQCGKRFKASSVFNHHLLTHGEARAYSCPFCSKTFKTRVQLAGHKNSHTKPFRCTECSRPFASLYAARAHIQTHKKDNNLKFCCYICGASYGRAFALKDHMKQHGEDTSIPPEPAREEEIQEAFIIREEEVEEDELVIPSPLPVAQSSGPEDSN